MVLHSSTLAWKIPWTEEPGRLQSMGSLSRTRLSYFTFTFHFHALEKEMAIHSSVLAWRIPGTGEPGGLPSVGSHRVGHDWSDLAAASAAGTTYKWNHIFFFFCSRHFMLHDAYSWIFLCKYKDYGDFPCGPVVKTLCSQCRGPGFSPLLGNRSHIPHLKSPSVTTKIQHSQINIKKHMI